MSEMFTHGGTREHAFRQVGGSHLGALAQAAAILIPVLVMLDPVLIWPLLYAVPAAAGDALTEASRGFSASLLRIVWFPPILVFAGVLFLMASRSFSGLARGPLVWWVLFFGWSSLSVTWALAPSISLARLALSIIMMASLVLAFATTPQRRSILVAVFWVFFVGVVANFAEIVSRPPGPIGHEGIFAHKNMLGAFAATSLLLALLVVPLGSLLTRLAGATTIVLAMVLLIASESKTSTGFLPVALAFGLGAGALVRWLRIAPWVSLLLVGIVGTMVLLVAEAVFALNPAQVTERLVGDPTLTGRTGLWSFAWDYVVQRPLLGYGFRSFWDIGPDTPSLSMGFGFIATTLHVHNGYLDILLNGGVIALLFFLPIVLIGLNAAGRLAQSRFWEGSMILAIMMFALLHNLLETSFFFGPHVIMIFHIVWLYVVFDRPEHDR